jgi:hypothetical protein
MEILGKDLSTVLENLRKGRKEPFIASFYQKLYSIKGHEYTPIWEKDWDTLLIIDACTADLAEEEFTEDKYSFSTTTAPGSSSKEWAEHFSEAEDLKDIVYISANPHVSNQKIEDFAGKNPFFMIYDVWKTDWDEEKHTVPAEKINEKFKEVREMYPEKRFILHYMQPHHPFIGEKQLEDTSFVIPGEEDEIDREDMVWEKLKKGEIDEQEFREAYRSNLQYVKNQIEKLPEIEGKTIITADHGNVFGKRGMYAHPPGVYFDELVEVPWIEVNKE